MITLDNFKTPIDIKKTRLLLGLTQTQAAALAGIQLNTWAKYESGYVNMPKIRKEEFMRNYAITYPQPNYLSFGKRG